jgi:hypothetical protein
MKNLRDAGSSMMTCAAVLVAVIWWAKVLQPLLPTLYTLFIIGLIIWFIGRR